MSSADANAAEAYSSTVPSADGELSSTGLPLNSLQTVPPQQMDSIVNVTREFPLDYAIIMFGYLLPVVLVVSIVTNCLVVAVLYQRHMRTPTNIVLLMMAIVDLATLLSPSPWYLYIYTLGNHDKFLYPPAACYAHHLMTDVVPVFFHTSSIWLALLLASQRYIYVCHPTLARTWCTVPRVKRAICAILAVAFLHQLTRFFDNTFIAVRVDVNGAFHMACKNEIAQWVHTLDVPRYYTTYFTFRILFVFIFPCTALITLNWLLFRALKRAETKRTMLLKTKFKIVGIDPTQATTTERVSSPNIFAAGRSQTASYSTRTRATVTSAGLTSSPDRQQRRWRSSDQSSAAQRANLEVFANDKGNQKEDRAAQSGVGADLPPTDTNILMSRSGVSNLVGSKRDRNLAHSPPLISSKADELRATITAGGEGNEQLTKGQLDRIVKPTTTPNRDEACHKKRRRSSMSRASGANHSVYSDNQSRMSVSSGQSSEDTQSDSQTSRSASSTTTAQTTKTDDDDDLSTCAECAAEFRRSCRRCSLAMGASVASAAATEEELNTNNTNTSAICDHHHKTNYQHQHRRLLHQPISQCSSILGGATNTFNEEDNSSCLATQNMSSSMFVPAVATLDAIETSSMHCSVDVDEQVQGEELTVDCELGHVASTPDGSNPTTNKEKLLQLSRRLPNLRPNSELGHHQLIKSGSVDSRIACGCPGKEASALRRHRSLSKPGQNSREQQADDCLDQAVRSDDQNCSPSNDWSPAFQIAGRVSCLGPNAAKGYKAPSAEKASVSLLVGRPDEPRAHWIEADNGQEGLAQINVEQQQQRQSDQTAPFQPTTADSLTEPLVPSPSCINGQDKDVASSQGKQTVLMVSQKSDQPRDKLKVNTCRERQQMESSSFACHVSGRASRTTLLGSGNPSTNPDAVPAIVLGSGQQNTPTAPHPVTTRSMDSNRTTLMLVVVVTVFLFVEVPVALMTIAHVILNTFDVFKDFEIENYLNYIKLITNFMIMISYSVNFTIYCSMSKRFRETFRDLFHCGRSGQRRRSKRIFSQSQAVHCNQLSAHTFGPASTMMTSMMNHNNQHNYQNHLSLFAARPSKQLTELTPAMSTSNQNLITNGQSLARRLNERIHNHYECEL